MKLLTQLDKAINLNTVVSDGGHGSEILEGDGPLLLQEANTLRKQARRISELETCLEVHRAAQAGVKRKLEVARRMYQMFVQEHGWDIDTAKKCPKCAVLREARAAGLGADDGE